MSSFKYIRYFTWTWKYFTHNIPFTATRKHLLFDKVICIVEVKVGSIARNGDVIGSLMQWILLILLRLGFLNLFLTFSRLFEENKVKYIFVLTTSNVNVSRVFHRRTGKDTKVTCIQYVFYAHTHTYSIIIVTRNTFEARGGAFGGAAWPHTIYKERQGLRGRM